MDWSEIDAFRTMKVVLHLCSKDASVFKVFFLRGVNGNALKKRLLHIHMATRPSSLISAFAW